MREGQAQLTHLAAAQPGLGDGRGQAQAVFSVATSERHQVAHRRMGRDGAAAYLILDLHGKLADQGQAARDPAHALVHPPGQILLAQPLAAQHRQQPALLQLREPLRAALAAVQQQGVALIEVPQRGAHGVRAQTFQTTQALEAIDDQVRAVLRDHHDRHLLAHIGERGQKAALTLGTPETQILVASVELMKLQIHGAPPSLRRDT